MMIGHIFDSYQFELNKTDTRTMIITPDKSKLMKRAYAGCGDGGDDQYDQGSY